jgi:pimeloyl-ACP methyl ester carboxylesterase
MPLDTTETCVNDAGVSLAFRRSVGAAPTIVWLPGFRSDLAGMKAAALHALAERTGRAFVRFDYTGHGASGGRFEEADLSTWIADALFMIDRIVEGPVVLVGSSMGGWIALRVAMARPDRVRGLVLIAPAPDFTERLMYASFDDEQRRRLEADGSIELRSSYTGESYRVMRRLIEDGRANLVLNQPLLFDGPVRILHGMRDVDVPFTLSLELVDMLTSADVRTTLLKSGDHRLSTPSDIALIEASLLGLLEDVRS